MSAVRHVLLLALACACLTATSAPAEADAAPAPAWRLDVQADTTAPPGRTLTYVVQMTNVGSAAVDPVGHPVTFTATLPSGVTALGVLTAPGSPAGWDCSSIVVGAQTLTCENHDPALALQPTRFVTLTLDVAVADGSAGVVTSAFELSGGGASDPAASTVEPTTITPDPPAFGIAAFDGTVSADPQGPPSGRRAAIRSTRPCRSTSTPTPTPLR